MRRMDAIELAEYLKSSKPLLLDVREHWEFEVCHIAESVNIPMNQVPQNLELINQAEECVVICHHGVRSMRIIQYLEQQSFDRLINLDGGVDAWARQVDSSMAVY